MIDKIIDEFSHLPTPQARYRARHPEKIAEAKRKYEQTERGKEVRRQINERRRLKRLESKIKYEAKES